VADLQVVSAAPASNASIRGLFTSRRDGVSDPPYDGANLGAHVGDDAAAVGANRSALAGRLGAPIVWMSQVHGSNVATVTSATPDVLPDTDALVTDRVGVGLGVLVADCVPVLLADVERGVVAAAHVGRRGLVARTAVATVDAMADLGAQPGRVQVWLGPSICGRCYEVPATMRAEVEAVAPGSAASTSSGAPAIDIRSGLRRQLLAAGVRTVRNVGPCTAESRDHYSYRRDGVTGRTAGVIVLTAISGRDD
jgi:YfiH family protein